MSKISVATDKSQHKVKIGSDHMISKYLNMVEAKLYKGGVAVTKAVKILALPRLARG